MLLRLLLGFGLVALTNLAAQPAPDYYFSTMAGSAGSPGSTDGPASQARFNRPYGVAVDATGNVYVAELLNHTVRRISVDGTVTTLAGKAGVTGSTDGAGGTALFGATTASIAGTATGPFGLASSGNGTLYVADASFHTIRQVSVQGQVSTFAGVPGKAAVTDPLRLETWLSAPYGVAVASDGTVYVADSFAHVIRRIGNNGSLVTIAGEFGQHGSADGLGAQARFLYPFGIAVDRAGQVFVTDSNNTVRRLTPLANGGSWAVTTIAGAPGSGGTEDGPGPQARFGVSPDTLTAISVRFLSPGIPLVHTSQNYTIGDLPALAVESSGYVLVADAINHTIRRISPAGVVSTIAGAGRVEGATDGAGGNARFKRPCSLAIDTSGRLYVSDSLNDTIRRGEPMVAPRIATQPSGGTIAIGSAVTLSVSVTSAFPTTYQWVRDGTALAGGTTSTLTLTNVLPTQAGTYTVRVSNAYGTTTSAETTVRLAPPPIILIQPADQTVAAGQPISLNVSAESLLPVSYQWQKDGVAVPGATRATLSLTNLQPNQGGAYVVTVANGSGQVVSRPAAVTVIAARLANLSIRSQLPANGALIVGFVVTGNGKSLLLRGVGPTLGVFGVQGALADPRITLHAGSVVVASNDNWGSALDPAAIVTAGNQAGAFALPPGSLDAALLATRDGGAYSAQVTNIGSAGGVVLVELYDTNPTVASRFVNVSARAQVGVGEGALFAGFVVSGQAPRNLLIRAVGPTLANFGVTAALFDPTLELFATDTGASLARNDDWGGAPLLASAFSAVGAFPLTAASLDACLIATLSPGSYSVQVTGKGDATGEALIELYELP
jgi:sugar lactone lactonase YvrE